MFCTRVGIRFQRIQQKLREGEQTCDLLFSTLLKTLRRSLDMAAERKRGVGDLELLCAELEREERQKEGRRERKRNKKQRRKEVRSHLATSPGTTSAQRPETRGWVERVEVEAPSY